MIILENKELIRREVIIIKSKSSVNAYIYDKLSDTIKRFIESKKASSEDIVIYTKGIEEIIKLDNYIRPKQMMYIYCGDCNNLVKLKDIDMILEHKPNEHICVCKSCSELYATAYGCDNLDDKNTISLEEIFDEDKDIHKTWASYMDMDEDEFIESQL